MGPICKCTPKTSKWMATTRNWHFFLMFDPLPFFGEENRYKNRHLSPAGWSRSARSASPKSQTIPGFLSKSGHVCQIPATSATSDDFGWNWIERFLGWDDRQIRSWLVKHVLRTIWQDVLYCFEDFEMLFGSSILKSASLCFQGFSAMFFSFAWFDTCVFLSTSAEDISKDPAY